jgi:hypothetical protein
MLDRRNDGEVHLTLRNKRLFHQRDDGFASLQFLGDHTGAFSGPEELFRDQARHKLG